MTNIDLSQYKAKPTETILEHNQELLSRYHQLLLLGCIPDNIKGVLRKACECHDFGKVNPEFQKRVMSNTKFDAESEIYHNILSIFLMARDWFASDEEYYQCMNVVLNHHNYCNPYDVIANQKTLIQSLLNGFNVQTIKRRCIESIKDYSDDMDTALTRGFLMKLDYSASSHSVVEIENDFLQKSIDGFYVRKNYQRNDLQEYAKNHSNENMILVASTGSGKTEAALEWAGNHKTFYFLPLMALNNSIYHRTRDIVEQTNSEKIGLLHSNNLNVYMNTLSDDSEILSQYQQVRQLSMPVTISTLDQLFDFVFKYKGSELKLATLSYSRIIIDEIQAYDAFVLSRLMTGLKVLTSLGVKVCIITATLPAFIREQLEDILGVKTQVFLNNTVRHNVKMFKKRLSADDVFNYRQKNLNKKILVVCNSVKKSQAMYKNLQELGIDNVNLLHSKFNKNHRNVKEHLITDAGKTENTTPCIWISTQIVEAGLDIDFDCLFTELSDLSALFQRMGRCNRKGLKDISDYNCFVYTELEPYLVGKVVDETMYQISKTALLSINGLLTEAKKQELVENSFTMDSVKHSHYYTQFNAEMSKLYYLKYADLEKKEVEFRDIKETSLIIPLSVYKDNIDFIADCLNILNNPQNSYLTRIKAMQEIKNLTLSMEKHKVKKAIGVIEISSYEKIFVVDCFYDENIGLV